MNVPSPDEVDDEVVGEVDLYLSQPDDHCELHILQYPLRDATIGIGKDRKITGVSVRPKHGRIEVRLAVLPEHPDPDEISSAEGCGKSFDLTQTLAEEKEIGDEQCLRSRHNAAPPATNFALAAYTDATRSPDATPFFTCVPVRAVSQLRPAFDYLDAFDAVMFSQRAAEKVARATARGIDMKQQQEQGEDDDASPLQVSFKKRETERAAERRKNSHATLRQKEEEEAWVPVQFVPAGNVASDQRRNKLFHSAGAPGATLVKEEALFDPDTRYTDLYRSHTRHVRLGLVAKGNVDPETLSIGSLKQLPADAAVAQIIARARLASFQDVRDSVAEGTHPNEILGALRLTAVCLRGCWVAKKGSKKGFDKRRAAAERFAASRDLILNEFRLERIVTFATACKAVGARMLLSEESVHAILREVATYRRGLGWEFRLEDDNDFIRQHPDLYRTQNIDWDRRVDAAREKLSKVKR